DSRFGRLNPAARGRDAPVARLRGHESPTRIIPPTQVGGEPKAPQRQGLACRLPGEPLICVCPDRETERRDRKCKIEPADYLRRRDADYARSGGNGLGMEAGSPV